VLLSLLRHVRYLLPLALLVAGCDLEVNKAHIRLLNTSVDYASLDFYIDGAKKLGGVSADSASAYVDLDPDTYTVKVTTNGVTSALATLSATLSKKSHTTVVGYGDKGEFAAISLAEDAGAPDSGETKLQALNVAPEAGALDIYITADDVALDDVSPTFASVAAGSFGSEGYVAMSSGNYRLRVTAASSKSDIRLDVSSTSLSFASKSVFSIIVTGTAGGTLVNAITLPQEGTPTLLKNSKARVRAVNGTAGVVTAAVDGTTLLAASAANAIGSYSQVDAGTVAVAVTVDGVLLSVDDQPLAAGGDYTLLAITDTSANQATLITDDNRLPASSISKLRIVNAMSSLLDPISLSVDYSPVAEGIALGAASSAIEETAGSDFQLDVSDTSTSDLLLTKTSVTLATQQIYTLFMFGGASSTTGLLRSDL
jgi:hypothetical protein